MRALGGAVAAAIMLACGVAAASAEGGAPAVEPPMQVNVVRSADPECGRHCPQWIAAQGRIVAGTARRFGEVLRQLGERRLPVLVNSGGGLVDGALSIGRLIRTKGLQVAVTRTVYTPCAPADTACRATKGGGELRGLAEARDARCASACAFVLAGGTERLVGPGAVVGVHQISMPLRRRPVQAGAPAGTQEALVPGQTMEQGHGDAERVYARIRQFLAEMGMGDGAMSLILSTPGSDIHWLTTQELEATHLATRFISGEELVTPTSTAALGQKPSTVP